MTAWVKAVRSAPSAPRFATLAAAQERYPGLTRDEYTLARVIASEFGSGTAEEMAAIGDADLNRAERDGRSVYDHATRGNGYGRQGEGSPPRPVATRLAPSPRHIAVVFALMRQGVRGIAKGATQYFDPRDQDLLNRQWSDGRRSMRVCPPLVQHERWAFGLSARTATVAGRKVCELFGTRKPTLEWVGPIGGVDPWRLFLFRRATSRHAELFVEGQRVIRSRGTYRGADMAILTLALVLGAGAMLV